MQALRMRGAGEVQVESTPEPGTCGPGEVRLLNRLAGICGTDLHEYLDGPLLITTEPHPLTGSSLPQILGHEYSGEVVEVGDGVTRVAVGDRVAVMPLVFCGACQLCLSGKQQCCPRLGAVGLNWPWGGMAEASIVLEHQVAVLPETVSDAAGAMVEPAAVALHAVSSAAVRPGDAVLVAGGGPIGQLICLAAAAAGAAAIVLSEPSDGRRARAAALDRVEPVDPTEVDLATWLSERLDGQGVDVAFECAGNQASLLDCVSSVRPGGTIVQTALHTRPIEVNPRRLTLQDITMRGVNCFPVTSWPRVISLIATGAMPVEQLISSTVPLSEAIDGAFVPLANPASGEVKVLLDPSR